MLHPVDSGKTIAASPTTLNDYDELCAVRDHIDQLTRRREELEYLLKAEMKDATELVGFTDRLATWKTHTKNKLDIAALRKAEPVIANKYTNAVEQRVFRLDRGGTDE
jgi:predicted phage-related endonuclease